MRPESSKVYWSVDMSDDRKAIIVSPDRHERMADAAKKSGMTLKTLTHAMVDFLLPQIEAGELVLGEPQLQPKEGDR